jgi:hypothetical protein
MNSHSSASAAIFQSTSLILTLNLDPADVLWGLERYVRGSLFDVQRIAIYGITTH